MFIKKKDFKRGQKKNLVKEDASSLNLFYFKGRKKFFGLTQKKYPYIKYKRLFISYFSERSFFWVVSFFSRLYLIFIKVRFVIWLNFLDCTFSLEKGFFYRMSNFILKIKLSNKRIMSTFLVQNFFNKILFFNSSKFFDWLEVEFSTF